MSTSYNLQPSLTPIAVCNSSVRIGFRQNRTVVVRSSSQQQQKQEKEKEQSVVTKSGKSIEECEADVVAGILPFAPPPKLAPAAPIGTPVAPSLPLVKRPRRNRRTAVLRSAFQETYISPSNFVYPLFIHEGEEDTPIEAMPGCYRLGWRHGLIEEVAKARDVGVNSIILFPKSSGCTEGSFIRIWIFRALCSVYNHIASYCGKSFQTPTGYESYNDEGLVQRAIRLLKSKYPDLIIYTDVALDPYSSDGHDGIVREDGVIMNDETVHQLCKQAVSQARAGADIVAPSDMMDGRIGAIRSSLDAEGFQHVAIMSYTAKYASAFYGPFREALDSNPRFGDKKTYQMNPANYKEAMLELHEDASEGADILLVKPGLPYLDIVRLLHDNTPLPIAAYQVSGEYWMIKAGGALGMIDEKKVMMESFICMLTFYMVSEPT